MNGVFTDQGFAGSCRGTDHDRMSLVEGIHGLQLEIIQREGKDSEGFSGALRSTSGSDRGVAGVDWFIE